MIKKFRDQRPAMTELPACEGASLDVDHDFIVDEKTFGDVNPIGEWK